MLLWTTGLLGKSRAATCSAPPHVAMLLGLTTPLAVSGSTGGRVGRPRGNDVVGVQFPPDPNQPTTASEE